MNNKRRKRLREAGSLIGNAMSIVEQVKDEEQDSLDNIKKRLRKHGLTPWSRRQESNPQPVDYKSTALPIELQRHGGRSETRTRNRPVMSRLL